MLRLRHRRHVAATAQATNALAAIAASVARLDDESVLDLADIFAADSTSPMQALAAAEMARRGLSL